LSTHREAWRATLAELEQRLARAEAMGGGDRVAKQHARGRLTARERIAALCDNDSFTEYGALAGGSHPGGEEPLAADGLVAGTARIDGRPTVVMAEDFTVKGGSIGHPNAAKRVRMVRLAMERALPLVLMLDGAGERAGNQAERYPNTPGDLQLVADLKGLVPVVTLVLGTSAGHGALTGMFADFIVMSESSAMFTAGPPLVKAALGVDLAPEQLGGAQLHARRSGVAHNVGATDLDCLAMARYFLSIAAGAKENLPATGPDTAMRALDELLDIIPPGANQPYDVIQVMRQLVDADSLFELQPDYGESMVVALARLGGQGCLLIANQPIKQAGAITVEAAVKAAHFIDTASHLGLPLISLIDNPGVMPGVESESAGVLRAAAQMFSAQRRYRGRKIVVTLRKAFGFGSSVMGMNPWDRQLISLALPSANLGGVPAIGGAEAARASDAEARSMAQAQSAAWIPADAMAFDRVIDPRELRNELISALRL
jgi:acetyl-CoA carboxylase carboxyltransferase component